MKTLFLTSPLTTGPAVTGAQQRLRSNAFGLFFSGKQDGVFGQETARACIRAKFWLGYPTSKQLPSYGAELDAYLSASKRLPVIYALRRQARLRAARGTPMRLKALAEAKKHLGEHESPAGSNRVSFSEWYGIIGPWCAMFVSWCYVQAGSSAFRKGVDYAYVPYIVHDARAGLNHLAIVAEPNPGDLVCYDWDHDGIADHVGLFERWVNKTRGTFAAVEGNTAVGNDSNGGEVMERTDRNRAEVLAFVHVGR